MHEPIPAARSYDRVTSDGSSRPILVGYDGSAPSRHALAYAAGMARRMNRPLVLAHVRPTPTCYAFDYGWPLPAEDPAELMDWLRTELVATIDPAGLAVQFVERMGDPARQLAALASETQADAIVLGAPRSSPHHRLGAGVVGS